MNKTAILLSAAIAFGTAVSAHAQSGTITFNGEITATTCPIDFGGGATGTDGNATVALGKVAAGSLTNGSRAGRKEIIMTVGGPAGTCTGSTSVAVELNPSRTAQVTPEGYLANTATTNPASNAVVALSDASGTDINLAGAWISPRVSIDPTAGAVLRFFGEMLAAGGDAGAGNVAGSVQYTLNYN